MPTIYGFMRIDELGTAARHHDAIWVQKIREVQKHIEPSVRLALKHGVRIAFGLDDDPERLPKEFEAMVKSGISPLGAIQAATVSAAELLGMSKDTGTIEPGKFADIIAVQGDPLQDISVMGKVVFVMKGGEVIKNEASSKK